MKRYVYINETDGNRVGAIIPEEDPIFPGISIEKRYTAEFLAECIVVPEETEVFCGMVYNPDDGTFSDYVNDTELGGEDGA